MGGGGIEQTTGRGKEMIKHPISTRFAHTDIGVLDQALHPSWEVRGGVLREGCLEFFFHFFFPRDFFDSNHFFYS